MKPKLRDVLARVAKNPTEVARHAPALCQAAVVSSTPTLRENGNAIAPTRRDELLAKCAAGEHVELELELLAYEQRSGERNRNSVRFRDGALMALGRSGKGTPFLRDHNQWSTLSKGGTVIASATEKRADGDYAVRQTVRLTAPWAVEMALRELMGPVSIGWRPTGPIECSHCNTEVFERCWHFPGDTIVAKDGSESTVEWIYTEAELIETSAVNVPGVPGARVEGYRASMLASLSAAHPGLNIEESLEENVMDPKLLELLGLPPTATAEQVAEAIRAKLAAAAADQATLTILQKDLEAFRKEIDSLNADRRKRDEDAFVTDALASGRIAKGDEEQWRALYQADAKRAGELMGKRAPGSATPVGQPRQSIEVVDRTGPVRPGANGKISKELSKALDACRADPRSMAFALTFGLDAELLGAGVPHTLAPTTISNASDLDAAKVGFHTAFLTQLEVKTDDPIQQLYTTVPSSKGVEEWNWFGDLPQFELWDRDRKMSGLEAFKMRLENKNWSSGLRIHNNDIKDDALGLLPPQIAGLAAKARRHRWDLMIKLLLNGFDGTAYPDLGTGLGYDGAFFFSDSGHRGGNDNKLATAFDATALNAANLLLRSMTTYDGADSLDTHGTHLIVGPKLETAAVKLLTQEYLASGESNPHKGKYTLIVSNRIRGTYDDYWFLADLSQPIKPLLFQMREEISTSAITGNQGGQNDSVPRFSYNELWFGAEARYNVGYFEHRLIVGSAVA